MTNGNDHEITAIMTIVTYMRIVIKRLTVCTALTEYEIYVVSAAISHHTMLAAIQRS